MSRSYFTEDDKMVLSPYPRWTYNEIKTMEFILHKKDYEVNIVSRVGCDRKRHDAWLVPRKHVPFIIEQLFRQRLVVEVQAEGKLQASINFVYDYSAVQVIEAVSRFQKRRNTI